MRLTLDTNEVFLPPDCFGCVRIGDEYRLFPFSSGRCISFTDAAKGKRGRLEIFRRIGKCHFDMPRQGCEEIRLECNEGDTKELQVQLTVDADNEVREQDAQKEKRSATKNGAKEYLATHQLEATLSDCIAKVLKEKPSDPLVALSKYLIEAHESRKPQMPPSSTDPDAQPPQSEAVSNPGVIERLPVPQLQLQSINRNEGARLYVLCLEKVSLNSSLDRFRSALRTLKSRMPDIPRCRCHWYLKDAHDASRSFGFEDTAHVALEYFAFVVVPTGMIAEASATLTVTSNSDNRHLGAHFVNLAKLGGDETFHSNSLPLQNQDGQFAQATIHSAAQVRWTSVEAADSQEQAVCFVDPAKDAQSRYILQCICRSACTAEADDTFMLPPMLPQL
eukprot:gnl/MRDRNA2_/MRDRNA2_106109_c0_seq1.p1 gnl/MRDRNA2_/MRDRNA2_106109_c0~~gnl/MRDRNA2_/MRDRNA2_106109_c0_seq1.p1  ORF type:complete len:391 (+),score=70.70 gnl/MRDRNA2_/MRDRNA2_106109_c0_seq1:103-1275(+)